MKPLSKGFLVPAIGNSVYGEMAFNFLMSVKRAEKSFPVSLLCDNKGIETLKKEHKNYFDKFIKIDSNEFNINGNFCPIRAKILAYWYSPYERTCLIDADSLWFENTKPSWLFGELEEYDYMGQIINSIDVQNVQDVKEFICWGKAKPIFETWNITKGKVYEINAFFWYFNISSEISEKLFSNALMVYDYYLNLVNNDKELDHKTWRGMPVEEVAMGIATNLTNIRFPKEPYQPIAHKSIVKPNQFQYPDEISKHFWAVTFPGIVKNHETIKWYNEKVEKNNYIFQINNDPFFWNDSGKFESNNLNIENKSSSVSINNNNLTSGIRLQFTKTFDTHRGGWNDVVNSLKQISSKNGLLFVDFIDSVFGFDYSEYRDQLPIKEPWAGIIHHPVNIPEWYNQKLSPFHVINTHEFQKSLENCVKLFVFSKDLKRKLETKIKDVEIDVLHHPTNFDVPKWNLNNWVKNNKKKVVQVGFWLRNQTSIYELEAPHWFQKVHLKTGGIGKQLFKKEVNYKKVKDAVNNSKVKQVNFMKNDDYDDLLKESVVFVDLYDTSCNNTVLECIARSTPILINYHPAVVEYLGKNYPLYYKDLREASQKLSNYELIKQAHNYLSKFNKDFIKFETFNRSVYEKLKNFFNRERVGLNNEGSFRKFKPITKDFLKKSQRILTRENFNKVEFKQEVINYKGNTYFGSKGGVYNPSPVLLDNTFYCFCRVEPTLNLPYQISDIFFNYPTYIGICLSDVNNPFSIKESKLLKFKNFPEKVKIEDFKPFLLNDSIYGSHTVVYEKDNETIIDVGLSKFNLEDYTLEFLGTPSIGKNGKNTPEKNWVFFQHDEELYCIYSVSPFVLYKKVNNINNIKKDWKQIKNIELSNFNFEPSTDCIVSNSASPIKLENNKLLLPFHKRDIYSNYKHGFIVINLETLTPIYYTNYPVFSGGSDFIAGSRKNILYLSGVEQVNKSLYLFFGEGDINSTCLEIDKNNFLNYIKQNSKTLEF